MLQNCQYFCEKRLYNNMGILSFAKLFKKTSLFFLRCQEQVITMQLSFYINKNKKHLKRISNGCSITVSADINTKKDTLNAEIKNILKQYKNDTSKILEYIAKYNTKVYRLHNAKKVLETIGEEPGLIPEYKGWRALVLNTVLFKKPVFKSEPMFIVDDKDVDIYYLIQQFHRWYFMKNNFEGFDSKSQILLKAVNKGNEDAIIAKLKPDDIISLSNAIARDVESINFVEQYARETAGSKKALEKIKNGAGASI